MVFFPFGFCHFNEPDHDISALGLPWFINPAHEDLPSLTMPYNRFWKKSAFSLMIIRKGVWTWKHQRIYLDTTLCLWICSWSPDDDEPLLSSIPLCPMFSSSLFLDPLLICKASFPELLQWARVPHKGLLYSISWISHGISFCLPPLSWATKTPKERDKRCRHSWSLLAMLLRSL